MLYRFHADICSSLSAIFKQCNQTKSRPLYFAALVRFTTQQGRSSIMTVNEEVAVGHDYHETTVIARSVHKTIKHTVIHDNATPADILDILEAKLSKLQVLALQQALAACPYFGLSAL
jgi:hypothetical protein